MLGTTVAAAVIQTIHVRNSKPKADAMLSGNIIFYGMVASHLFQFVAVSL
jgi:hypothetical protein